MKTLPIEIDPTIITAFCRRHSIAWMSLFGSILRDDFGPESDVDILVEYLQGNMFTLTDFCSLKPAWLR